MPGWYIHLDVARKIANILPQVQPGSDFGVGTFEGPGPSAQDLAEIIANHPNYYALGALGPDIFYFLPDFKGKRGNMIAEAAAWVIKAYDIIDKNIVGPWQDKFAPLSQDSSQLVSMLTGGLSDELGRLSQYASGIFTELIFDLLSVAFPDWFGLLGCGPGGAFDDSLFMWSDMFHYRRTNEFACDLFQHAREAGYEPGMAFALGWMTHIGTDVTGHAFVNEKVGGPFRLHWQRHHLVENHMDAHTYAQNHQGATLYDMEATSALHFWIQFRENATPKYSPKYNYLLGIDPNPPDLDPNAPTAPLPQYPTGLNSADYYNRQQIFDVDATIPPELVSFLREVMKATFYDRNTADSNDAMPTHPMILTPVTHDDGRPDLDQMNANFQVLYEYLKLTTTSYYNMPMPVPPDVIPDNLNPPIPPGNDDPPSSLDAPLNFLDVLIGVVAVIAYIADWLLYVVTLLPALIADLATYPARVVLYEFEMGFYLLWKQLRYLLVIEGFDLPQPDEIDRGLITLGVSSKGVSDHLLTSLVADVYGGLFGYGDTPPPAPDEPAPDQLYPRDTVVDEENVMELLVSGVRNLLDQVDKDCTADNALGPNNPRLPSEYLSPWRYPLHNYAGQPVLSEPGLTTAGPYQPGTPFALPDFLVESDIPGTDQARKSYEDASTPATTDALTNAIAAGQQRDVPHIVYLANSDEGLGHVRLLEMSPGGTWSAADVTQAAGAPAAAFQWGALTLFTTSGAQHVAYIDSQGHVRELSLSPGQGWAEGDVTGAAGAPAAGPAGALTSWALAGDDTQHIAYIDGQGQVQELTLTPGQDWAAVNVTQAASAPAAGPAGALTSWVLAGDDTQHIAYIDGQGQVQELTLTPGQDWAAVNVTQAVGAPPAQGLSFTLTSWTSASDGAQHIAYVDGQGHVQDLSQAPGQGWQVADVTQAAGAPVAELDSPLASWVSDSDNAQHIAYLEGQNHVQELSQSPGQGWQVADVTQAAAAPPGQWGALTSWTSTSDGAQHIAYLDDQCHVQELSAAPGQGWSAVDLTQAAGAPAEIQVGALARWASVSDSLDWNNLGDPVHFSLYVIGELTRDTITDPGTIASFNLDSDRGYGYKCWDYDRIRGYEGNPTLPAEYAVYPNSVPPTRYAVPCTPPRGFNKYSLCKALDTVAPHGNPTLAHDRAIIPILSLHDYHPLHDLQIHYLTRFLCGLAASPGDGHIRLTWKPMSGAASYNLYRSVDQKNWTQMAGVVSGHIDAGLAPGKHFYAVAGVDAAGAESPRSAQAVAVPGAQVAGAPANVAAAAGFRQTGDLPGDNVIEVAPLVTVTWASVPGAGSYILYRSTDELLPKKNWQKLAQPVASPYADIDVRLGATYYYYVTAVSPALTESGPSLVAGAMPGSSQLHYPQCDHMGG